MKRRFGNNKGMTLIEAIVALAILGIVSAPLLVVFTNAQLVIRNTESRLEANAVMRIIKENVTASVKFGGFNKIKQIGANGAEYDLSEDNGDVKTDLEIKGKDQKVNARYKFDLKRTVNFGELPGDPANPEKNKPKDTCEYEITLRKMDGQEVQKLKILINSLKP